MLAIWVISFIWVVIRIFKVNIVFRILRAAIAMSVVTLYRL